MARREDKEKAIRLRKEGHSYSYINKKLGIPNGTLSYMLSDIPYKPNKETKKRIQENINRIAEYSKKEREKSKEQAQKEAIKL